MAQEKDEQNAGNLSVIKGGRQKKESSDKPPRLAEIYVALADMVNRQPYSTLPKLSKEFFTVELAKGVRQIVTRNSDDSLRFAPDSELVNALLEHGNGPLAGKTVFTLTHAQAVECVKTWRGLTPPLEDVPYTRWLSEPGYCWRRIPFDLVPDEDLTRTPTWSRLLSKIENPKVRVELCAYLWSLIEARAYRQQYVWIYGRGGNGKGCIARFSHRLFGTASHFISFIPDKPNQFWTAQFVRRRLIVVPDCDKHAFPASGFFKTLTGDDPVNVEGKNKDPYTAILDVMFLFTSNEMPTLSSENADMRRAILVRMEGNGTWEAGFEEKLWDEAGAFLWHCQRFYRELCPDFGPIPTDETDIRDHVSSLEEEDQLIFNEWFNLQPDSWVEPKVMTACLTAHGLNENRRKAFRKWLERALGVRLKATRRHPTNNQVYVGMETRKTPAPLPPMRHD